MQQQTVQLSGAKPTFSKPALADTVPVHSALIVKNDSAADITVTLVTEGKLGTGDDYPDKVYTVTVGGESWIPVIRDYIPADGSAPKVNFSATTSVTAAAVAIR